MIKSTTQHGVVVPAMAAGRRDAPTHGLDPVNVRLHRDAHHLHILGSNLPFELGAGLPEGFGGAQCAPAVCVGVVDFHEVWLRFGWIGLVESCTPLYQFTRMPALARFLSGRQHRRHPDRRQLGGWSTQFQPRPPRCCLRQPM
jgi:hypothetical protein